jgi:DNA polymerase IV (DinB-like DNA polymerase)
VCELVQKLVSAEKNASGSVEIAQQERPVSPIWPGRVIMHIDMNAFFPACEELRDPSLKGRAHAVIMTPEKEGGLIARGAVASCSYEARKYGVRSAMSLSRAKELCPDLLLRPVDKEYYSSVSQQVMRLLEEYADVLEQTSIDEAFVDCTNKLVLYQQKKSLPERFDEFDYTSLGDDNASKPKPALCHSPKTRSHQQQPFSEVKSRPAIETVNTSGLEEYALKIKSSIREQCNGLICSIGVASNKSIAKIASDFQKPDGLTIVHPQNALTFLSKLAVDRVSGIGTKTAKTLKGMGINTIGELSKNDVQKLLEKFGKKQGLWMWQIANGTESEPVVPRGDNLSLSSEETLLEPINDRDEILKILLHSLTDDIYNRLVRKGYVFKTVGIKLVRTNFSIETREFTFSSYQRTRDSISSILETLLDRFNFENDFDDLSNTPNLRKIYPSYVRKLGIKVSNLSRIDVSTRSAQKSILDFV